MPGHKMIKKVNWRELLDRSSFRDQRDCILKTLELRNVNTWNNLENLPRRVGTSICGRSTYLLIRELFALRDGGIIVAAASESAPPEIPEIGEIVMKSKPKRRMSRSDDVEAEIVATDDGE